MRFYPSACEPVPHRNRGPAQRAARRHPAQLGTALRPGHRRPHPGGQRLYTDRDIDRLRALKALLDDSLAAGEAHNVLRQLLQEPRPGGSSGSPVREEARRLRAQAAQTHEDAATAYEQAAERFISLAAATSGPAADRLRQLADRASTQAAHKRALAADSRARSSSSS